MGKFYWHNKKKSPATEAETPPETSPVTPEITEAEQQTAEEKSQYRDKFQLLNKGERDLYFKLVEAVPKLIVLSQVSLSQVFFIRGKDGLHQLGKVGRKSLDFLICRDDFSIVSAIELNGPTHEREKQQQRDEVKRAALESAGIPLLIYTPDELPDIATIRKDLAPAIVGRKAYEAERDKRFGR